MSGRSCKSFWVRHSKVVWLARPWLQWVLRMDWHSRLAVRLRMPSKLWFVPRPKLSNLELALVMDPLQQKTLDTHWWQVKVLRQRLWPMPPRDSSMLWMMVWERLEQPELMLQLQCLLHLWTELWGHGRCRKEIWVLPMPQTAKPMSGSPCPCLIGRSSWVSDANGQCSGSCQPWDHTGRSKKALSIDSTWQWEWTRGTSSSTKCGNGIKWTNCNSQAYTSCPHRRWERRVPMGPVRELWHVANPINGEIPIPTGIQDLQHWSTTVIQMEKYKGKTFGEILEMIRMGNREVIQWASWLVHRYSHAISKTPKTQAPDMAAYLLRCGFERDERRTESISYVRTYSGHRMAQWKVMAYGWKISALGFFVAFLCGCIWIGWLQWAFAGNYGDMKWFLVWYGSGFWLMWIIRQVVASGRYDNEISCRLGFCYGRKMLQVSDRWESLIGCLQWTLGILSDRIDIKRGYGRIWTWMMPIWSDWYPWIGVCMV